MNSVDVVVPCYRYGLYLRECVQSVLSQADVASRVLIIDDASPDDTASISDQLAAEDSRITVIHHRANMGHIATYNEGNAWTSAPYYLLLSADDYLLPGALQRAVRVLDRHPEVGFVFGMALELSQNGATTEVRPFSDTLEVIEDVVMSGSEFIALTRFAK